MANKNTIAKEFDAIKAAFEKHKGSVSIEQIKDTLVIDIELRTLQRRLKTLKELGEISVSGHTKAALYSLIKAQTEEKNNIIDSIPLSGPSREIRTLITQPEHIRRPVAYHREFLDLYTPNTDSYLTAEEKNRLRILGNTARLEQPAGTYAKEILQRLLIDLSWNSSRLEGNTYSLLDTQRLIAYGETADNKLQAESQMILNHKDAIEFLVQGEEEIGFNRYTVLNLHALLSNNLLPDPAASGRLRTHGVGIARSVYTPPAVPQLIEKLFEQILLKAAQINDPFEQAFFMMVHIPYLQPFDDVNKRVSRIAANISLNEHNLAPLSFVDVPNDLYIQGMLSVYELNRIELLKDVFLWAYERSAARYSVLRQSIGEPDPFRLKYRDEIRSLIVEIVSTELSPKEASKRIKVAATRLPEEDHQKFMEIVDTELLALHDGNFARYKIRPAEFATWKEIWTGR